MDLSLLTTVWQDVEAAYNDERINSERALQAILYCSLSSRLPDNFLILVEPNFEGYRPDLVVVDRNEKVVVSFFELKCAPHWWHSEVDVEYDLDKLHKFAKLATQSFEFDVFGPNRMFDREQNIWIDGRPQYSITDTTIIGFVDIVRKESSVTCRNSIKHPVASLPNFVLLTGATDPDARSSIFTLQ